MFFYLGAALRCLAFHVSIGSMWGELDESNAPACSILLADSHQAKQAAVGSLGQRDCSLVHMWLTGCPIFSEQLVAAPTSTVCPPCGFPDLVFS